MTAVNTESTKSDAIHVTADAKNWTINGTADIGAPPERIFRALTTSEQADWSWIEVDDFPYRVRREGRDGPASL